MRTFSRADRVGAQIQKELSDLLLKEIQDPRLATAVITGVKISRDLRFARVYFSLGGAGGRRGQAMEAFKAAHGFVKRALAGRLGLRYMPDLRFCYDESFDYGAHIDGILKSLNTSDEPDLAAPEKE